MKPCPFKSQLIDPALLGCNEAEQKATADPSTSLRFAQDDRSVVVQFFGDGSIIRDFLVW
jgi:hypothetical protein